VGLLLFSAKMKATEEAIRYEHNHAQEKMPHWILRTFKFKNCAETFDLSNFKEFNTNNDKIFLLAHCLKMCSLTHNIRIVSRQIVRCGKAEPLLHEIPRGIESRSHLAFFF